MIHREPGPWLGWLGVGAGAIGAGEWLVSPSIWAIGLVVAGATVALWPRIRIPTGPAFLMALLAITPVVDLGLVAVARRSDPLFRGRATRAAEVTVVRALDAARHRLTLLASRAAALDPSTPEKLFDDLQRAVPELDPETGLALTSPSGLPEVWGGRHRVTGDWSKSGLEFISTGYYAVLEVRRHRPGGGMAVASTTLAADSLLPMPVSALTAVLVRRHGFTVEFLAPTPVVEGALPWPADQPVLQARAVLPTPAALVERLRDQTRVMVALLLLALVLCAILIPPDSVLRYGGLLLLLWLGVRSPVALVLGGDAAWSPSTFFSSMLGPLSTAAGPLILTGLVGLVLAVALWHRAGRWHSLLWLPSAVLTVGTPYLIRAFGKGITPPAHGVTTASWWTWHLALLIPAAITLTVSAGLLRRNTRLPVRNGPATLGAVLAVFAAVVGILAFTGQPGWPAWYTALWVPAVGLVAFPAPRRRAIICLGIVAGSGAALMTWGTSLAGRTDVALQDLRGLGAEVDPLVEPLLLELGRSLTTGISPTDGTELYHRWSTSGLAQQGYPARLDLWTLEGAPVATAALDQLLVPDSTLSAFAATSGSSGSPVVTRVAVHPGVHYLLGVRVDQSHVATVLVGPRSALIVSAALGRSLATSQDREALYRLSLATSPMGRLAVPEGRWRREGWALRLWETVDYPEGPRETHVLIPLGRPPWIQVRGALLILLDVLLLWALWSLAERVAGIPRPRVDLGALSRSFRARLALALALFCIFPAAFLGGLAMTQLGAEAARSRELVLQRVLRDATPADGLPTELLAATRVLVEQRDRLDADLALYRRGRLEAVSDSVLSRLGVLPPLLQATAWHAIQLDGDRTAGNGSGLWGAGVRVSYAAVLSPRGGPADVLATLAPASDRDLRERQTDVAALLLLATLFGVLAALVGADRASHALSRPVTDLRQAAIAFGAGRDPEPPGRQPPEFEPVFEAFGRMATDVKLGQAALELARRRTATVLTTVTTGVVAVDGEGRVLLANRRAAEALGSSPQPGKPLAAGLEGPWSVLEGEVADRLAGDLQAEAELELDAGDRRYVVQFASLGPDVGGLVLAINDVTETTRAARILAWGEVASQVAHAIKNPLTPVRLGIQHLQRVRETRPSQLPIAMDETIGRLLAEIDRLDAIARAFARFATPEAGLPLEQVPVAELVREVAALYDLIPGIRIDAAVPGEMRATCRRDELKEVLLNLLDNARNAGATALTVRAGDSYMEVRDDGRGIPAELLPKVFEPRFTTTSSGAGLGLAIVRRLVEGWQGAVSLESVPEKGTTVRIDFALPNAGGG